MLYLKGKQGIGKSSPFNLFKSVLGHKCCLYLNNDRVFNQLNGPLMGKTLVILDEICHDYNDFKSLGNSLKPYITEPIIGYRDLYEKMKPLKNLSSFVMSGNFDMLKLDPNGEDRRTKINDCDNVLKEQNYYDDLQTYCEDENVIYAMFWYCIDNFDDSFNELKELKLLPVTETKKNMIRQSLDTSIIFLKHFINDVRIDDFIKPKELYSAYEEYMVEKEKKKQVMNKNTFLEKIKDFLFIKFHYNKKLNNCDPTNYIKIDRNKMIEYFRLKNYFDEYDEIIFENLKVIQKESDEIIEMTNSNSQTKNHKENLFLKEENIIFLFNFL